MNKKTIIIIFCFNVENFIKKTIYDLKKKKLFNCDYLYIDDGSTDTTLKKINKYLKLYNFKNYFIKINKINCGYGKNYKTSFNFAISKGYKKLIFYHGDNQYPSSKIYMLNKLLEKNDLVFGSRKKNYMSIKKNMPILRYIGNIFLTKFINILYKSKTSEYFSGFRGFKTSALKKIQYQKLSDSWIIEQQVHFIFLKKKFRIKEIAIPTVYDGQSSYLPVIRYCSSVIYNAIKFYFLK
jgi:glycosyltransferase involved in cell wall biosynthesis